MPDVPDDKTAFIAFGHIVLEHVQTASVELHMEVLVQRDPTEQLAPKRFLLVSIALHVHFLHSCNPMSCSHGSRSIY